MLTDLFREIKKTRSRFLSILAIVALGVSFFVGIRSAGPDMQTTADGYFDETHMHDIRIISTMGLMGSDIAELIKQPYVDQVMPGYFTDVKLTMGVKGMVLRLHSMPTGNDAVFLDRPVVLQGRLPKQAGECAVEEEVMRYFGLSLGDSITFDEDTNEGALHLTRAKVVGVVESPLYISMERGTTSLGNGQVDAFVLMPNEVFASEVYTQAVLTLSGTKDLNCFSKEYARLVDGAIEALEDLSIGRSEARLDDVRMRARGTLSQNQSLLNSLRSTTDEGIADGLLLLEESLQALLDGEDELYSQEKSVMAKLKEGEREIQQNQLALNAGEAALKAQEDEFYNVTKPQAQKALLEAQNTLEQARAAMEVTKGYFRQLGTFLQNENWEFEDWDAQDVRRVQEMLKAMLQYAPDALPAEFEEIAQLFLGLDADDVYETFKGKNLQEIYRDMEALLLEAERQLDEGFAQLRAQQQSLTQGESQLKAARAELEANKALLEKARRDFEAGRQLAYAQLDNARLELAAGWAQYNSASAELLRQNAEAARVFTEMEKQIRGAYDELDRLKEPSWHVLGRDSNYGYADFEQNTQRIDAIGQVVPVLFFLVAALVSLTSMTRMVEEGRTQNGVLKALGYEGKDVALKYIMYALFAAVAGSAIGLVLGFTFLPYVIYEAYGMMYTLPGVRLQFLPDLALIGLVVGIGCTAGAAFMVVRKQMGMNAATLMRPKAPKSGKRVLLERIEPLWRHFSYNAKVTTRNLFRYKKRFFMTVFGIAGCTALLVTGFGLQDSIKGMVGWQFGDILTYDLSVVWSQPSTEMKVQSIEGMISRSEGYASMAKVQSTSVELEKGSERRDVSLIVAADTQSLYTQLNLRERRTKKPIELSDQGAVLTEKMAKLLGVQAGDYVSLVVQDDDGADRRYQIRITGVTENYAMHNLYMSRGAYEGLMGKSFSPNAIFASFEATTEEFEAQLCERLMQQDGVLSASFNTGLVEYFDDMMGSLDSVIWIIILAAGALAFIVLFNLTNINVTERERELATIKVLGFYDAEVTGYIARESVVLTLVGTAAGLLLGIALHAYIITTVEVDMVMFGRDIEPLSFFLSAVMTMGFSLVVNLGMHVKLKKINMIEALKSVE